MHATLVAVLVAAWALQAPPAPPRTGPDPPVNDPVTMRGCLEGRYLKILEHDVADLSGVRRIRLKGPKGVMETLDDAEDRYVELTGRLLLHRRDRVETRKKAKAGSKTTISVGAATEQITGEPVRAADPVLEVEAFTPLGERCPGR